MATARRWFGDVAAALAGVDATDDVAVGMFYRYCLAGYPRQARELIADFLIGLERAPRADELARLCAAIAGSPESIGEVPAPDWPAATGDTRRRHWRARDITETVNLCVNL